MRKNIVLVLLLIAGIVSAREINFKVTPQARLKGIEKNQIEPNFIKSVV
ncbi:MAG: hypothetical protein PHR83_15415 [Paludibacter sp.]|nr:hypothetical protein [Paludibacter sp.]